MKPNILFIYTDQHHHAAIGCAGDPVLKTPNLDELARSGIRFTNAYCPSPVCGPSRAATFSGQYPPTSGVLGNGDTFSHPTRLFTNELTALGYFTGLVGKLHLTPNHHPFGFQWKQLMDAHYGCYEPAEAVNNDYFDFLQQEDIDGGDRAMIEAKASQSERLFEKDGLGNADFWLGDEWVEERYHHCTWTGDQALRFLDECPVTQPFFLNMSFFGPHHPYMSCSPWSERYDPRSIALPRNFGQPKDTAVFQQSCAQSAEAFSAWDENQWRTLKAQYYGQISQIDHQIGRIFNALKERNLWKSTQIVFLSDHGDSMGEAGLIGKSTMYEGSVRVPCIIKPVGNCPHTGKVCDKNVNGIDIYATILELAGASAPVYSRTSSQSLIPLLADPSTPDWNNTTYSVLGTAPDTCLSMIKQDDWKLIRQNIPGIDSVFECYQLSTDPDENVDLFTSLDHAPIVNTLSRNLDDWILNAWDSHA